MINENNTNMTTFDFRFNEKTFDRSLNSKFSSKKDIESYFLSFRKHYDSFVKNPKFKNRMKGEFVKDYDKLHSYSVQLEDHYGLLLVIGKNGFDTWLNDLVK